MGGAGGGLFLAATVLFWWAHRELGRNWNGVVALVQDHELVTGRPSRDYMRTTGRLLPRIGRPRDE